MHCKQADSATLNYLLLEFYVNNLFMVKCMVFMHRWCCRDHANYYMSKLQFDKYVLLSQKGFVENTRFCRKTMLFHQLAAVLDRGEVLKDWKKEEVDCPLSSHHIDPLLVNFLRALYFLASTLLIGIPWQGHQPLLEVALTSGHLLLLLVLDHLVDRHRLRCMMC